MIDATGTDNTIVLPDGRTLAYREYGPRDGQPLLYLHSNPGTRDQLPPALHALAGSHRIVVPERPGYGKSTPRASSERTDILEEIDAVRSATGITSFRVIGFSTGAAHALALASALPAVSGLVVISPLVPGLVHEHREELPPPLQEFLDSARAGTDALIDEWTCRGTTAADVIDRLTASLSDEDRAPLEDPDVQPWLGLDQSESADGGMAGMAADYAFLARTEADVLDAIACPVDIWHGERDRIAPPVIAERLAERLDRATHRLEADVGHLLPFTKRPLPFA